ncbi:hypothetical protein VTJ04DRAFT_5829 [Mycothermus thermophilus]|uniref:uncharacterized protein n=1 Tax=Humicola insolens TaxID=85995 RepID=UPI003744763A
MDQDWDDTVMDKRHPRQVHLTTNLTTSQTQPDPKPKVSTTPQEQPPTSRYPLRTKTHHELLNEIRSDQKEAQRLRHSQ